MKRGYVGLGEIAARLPMLRALELIGDPLAGKDWLDSSIVEAVSPE